MNISYVKTMSNRSPKDWESHYFLSAGAFARELPAPPVLHPIHRLFFHPRQPSLCCHRVRAKWFGFLCSWHLLILDSFPDSLTTVLAVFFQVLLLWMSCTAPFLSPYPVDLCSLVFQSSAVLIWHFPWACSLAPRLCAISPWPIISHLDFQCSIPWVISHHLKIERKWVGSLTKYWSKWLPRINATTKSPCLTGRWDNRVQGTTFTEILYCVPPVHYYIYKVFSTCQVLCTHYCISLHHVQLCYVAVNLVCI